MATFAQDFNEFPEANQPLGAGRNENTYDIVIHRVPNQGDYAKVFLTDEEVAKLVEKKEFYIFVKGPFYPLAVLVDSPFISAEQQAEELNKDIEKVNQRLRDKGSLRRVNKDINFVVGSEIAAEWGDSIYEDAPYLVRQMRLNSKMD